MNGKWHAESNDPRRWEIICARCGDTDGPASEQSPQVQELRGPYRSRRKAEHRAEKHFEQTAKSKRVREFHEGGLVLEINDNDQNRMR